MTGLAIKVDHAAKTLQVTGSPAVNEDVSVSVEMGEEVADPDQLRLRVRHMGRDVAVFPFAEGDEWTVDEEKENAYGCVLNLGTAQMQDLFAGLPDRASLPFDIVVDQVPEADPDGADDHYVLYGRGRVKVWNWNADMTVTDVDEGRRPVSMLDALDGKADRPATATAGNLAKVVDEGTEGSPKYGFGDSGFSVDAGRLSSSNSTIPTSAAVKAVADALAEATGEALDELAATVNSKASAASLASLAEDVEAKADAADLTAHAEDGDIHVSEDDRAKWNAAEPNVQADWAQSDTGAPDFVKNKPVIDVEFDADSGNAVSNSRVATFHAEYHANKTATDSALQAKADLVNGKVPATQLPSYVDDVVEGYYYDSKFYEESTHVTEIDPEKGKIYVDLATEKTYRWGGSAYAEISPSPDLTGYKTKQTAVTDPTASGTAVAFIDSISQNANGVVTPTKKTVANAVASTSGAGGSAGLMTAADKEKLNGIAAGATAVTVDSALSDTSTNPVQNKAVKAALDAKLGLEEDVGGNRTAITIGSRVENADVGPYSIAIGEDNEASGDFSVALGQGCVASEDYAFAEGYENTASGATSHAEGEQSVASGMNSHAEGYLTEAEGANSFAGGCGAYASHDNSFVWSGGAGGAPRGYQSHGDGTFNVNPAGGLAGFYIGQLNMAQIVRYARGTTMTASGQLADRVGNRVVPLADNAADIVLTFPDAVTGYLRDFLVLVTNTTGNTGDITFSPPTGARIYGNGFTNSPASGETWLYSVTEVADNEFFAKSEKMEVAS